SEQAHCVGGRRRKTRPADWRHWQDRPRHRPASALGHELVSGEARPFALHPHASPTKGLNRPLPADLILRAGRGPAAVNPQPLGRALADQCFELLRKCKGQTVGILVCIAALRNLQWGMHAHPKTRASDALYRGRDERRPQLERQHRRSRGRHRLATEKRNRQALIGLLIGKQTNDLAAAKGREDLAGATRPFRDLVCRAVLSTLRHHPAVDIGIVDRAVYLGASITILHSSERHKLPVRKVPGEEDEAPASRPCRIRMLSARDRY